MMVPYQGVGERTGEECVVEVVDMDSFDGGDAGGFLGLRRPAFEAG